MVDDLNVAVLADYHVIDNLDYINSTDIIAKPDHYFDNIDNQLDYNYQQNHFKSSFKCNVVALIILQPSLLLSTTDFFHYIIGYSK
jgi:small basic protein